MDFLKNFLMKTSDIYKNKIWEFLFIKIKNLLKKNNFLLRMLEMSYNLGKIHENIVELMIKSTRKMKKKIKHLKFVK